jgi:hypothetical protein
MSFIFSLKSVAIQKRNTKGQITRALRDLIYPRCTLVCMRVCVFLSTRKYFTEVRCIVYSVFLMKMSQNELVGHKWLRRRLFARGVVFYAPFDRVVTSCREKDINE